MRKQDLTSAYHDDKCKISLLQIFNKAFHLLRYSNLYPCIELDWEQIDWWLDALLTCFNSQSQNPSIII